MTKAILFDLDGTLIDTGPDFEFIVNTMRAERGLSAIDYDAFRPNVAIGSAAMTQFAFDLTPEHPDYDNTLETFYQAYMENMGRCAKLFPGIAELIGRLEENDMKWGVVTNRQLAFIPQILKQFDLHDGAHCIVGSDSTPHRKPHPAPLLHAAESIAVAPEDCLYVGDFVTDIEAAHAAGMASVAVTWGYHNGIDKLKAAKPTHIVDDVESLLAIINQ